MKKSWLAYIAANSAVKAAKAAEEAALAAYHAERDGTEGQPMAWNIAAQCGEDLYIY